MTTTTEDLLAQLATVQTEARAITTVVKAIGTKGMKRDDLPAGKLIRAALRVLEQNGYISNDGVETGSITLTLTPKGQKFLANTKRYGY